MPADDDDAVDADVDTFDTIVGELYAVVPAEFTAARTARAKEAEGPLAARIRKIRKPVVAAWVVDLLAREGMLSEALELGAALREAQDNLDAAELSRLGQQRRQLVAALGRQAAAAAEKQGVTVSAAAQSDIESTLNAALIDADAAAAVATARLAVPLEAGAAGDFDLAGAVTGSVPAAAVASPPTDELAERRARRAADQAVRDAERAVERAERERTQAQAKHGRAQERAGRLAERVEALRADLARAEAEAADAQDDLDQTERTATQAAEAEEAARAARDEAQAARDRLG